MEREAVLVGIDVGTSKVCPLIGEVGRDGRLTIMGHGTVPASGLKKGVVINIDQTVRSIADEGADLARADVDADEDRFSFHRSVRLRSRFAGCLAWSRGSGAG